MNQQEIYRDLLEYMSHKLNVLPDKPEENPENTLHALWLYSCGINTNQQTNSSLSLPELDEKSLAILQKLIQRRIKGTPLAHLTGVEKFMNIEFKIDSRALIPRKETELLGYAALERINEIARNKSVVDTIDVCTGMGNLALAFAYHQPKTKVWASDLSEDAILLAKQNAQKLGLEEKVIFFTGDLLEPLSRENLSDSIDVLTCNPPYISSAKVEKMPDEISKHEPKMAFDGGSIGLQIIFRLINEAPAFLRNNGWLCFEVGSGQGEGLLKFVKRNEAFSRIETVKTEAGDIRVILAQVDK